MMPRLMSRIGRLESRKFVPDGIPTLGMDRAGWLWRFMAYAPEHADLAARAIGFGSAIPMTTVPEDRVDAWLMFLVPLTFCGFDGEPPRLPEHPTVEEATAQEIFHEVAAAVDAYVRAAGDECQVLMLRSVPCASVGDDSELIDDWCRLRRLLLRSRDN